MDEYEHLKTKIKFEKYPPPPVPGLFCMEMTPNIDTMEHCSSLDQDYKTINTPILEMFPIDIMSELKELEESIESISPKKDAIFDNNYYQEKIDRNERLMRDEQKHYIEDVLDYSQYLENTFKTIQGDLEGYEIEEEYPLIPNDQQYVVVTGDVDEKDDITNFRLETSATSLIEKCTTGDKSYNSIKLHVEDKICIEIRDGKAFYSSVKYAYKFNNTA